MGSNQLIFFLIYVFEALIAFTYYSGNFKMKKKYIFSLLILYVLYFLGFAINIIDNNVNFINGIAFFLINLIFSKLCFEISFKQSVFHSAILLVIMFLTELILQSFLSVTFDIPLDAYRREFSILIILAIISKVLYLIVVKLITILFCYKKLTNVNLKRQTVLFIYPILVTVILIIFLNTSTIYNFSKGWNLACAIVSIISLFFCCYIFIFNGKISEQEAKLIELEKEQQYTNMNNDYMQVLEHQNNEINMLLHDTKNHYLAISNMNSAEEMKEYIANVLDDVQQYNIVHLTNNKMLDLLLSKYSVLCQNNGVKLNVEVKTANLLYVPEADLSTIINNLMDNALESAKVSTEKEIDFSIRHINGFDTLTVSNSCDEEPMQKSGKLITTKTAKSVHGFGTKIIKKYATKNNATYEWFYDSEKRKFNSTIIFQSNN